ncbi:MAG: hypothetical protein ABIT20_11725 [Gemmatimonadaceae bacterium]
MLRHSYNGSHAYSSPVLAALRYPGFLRATATAVVDGANYTGMATAGFTPEKITPSVTMPDDFQQFWAKSIADAHARRSHRS